MEKHVLLTLLSERSCVSVWAQNVLEVLCCALHNAHTLLKTALLQMWFTPQHHLSFIHCLNLCILCILGC